MALKPVTDAYSSVFSPGIIKHRLYSRCFITHWWSLKQNLMPAINQTLRLRLWSLAAVTTLITIAFFRDLTWSHMQQKRVKLFKSSPELSLHHFQFLITTTIRVCFFLKCLHLLSYSSRNFPCHREAISVVWVYQKHAGEWLAAVCPYRCHREEVQWRELQPSWTQIGRQKCIIVIIIQYILLVMKLRLPQKRN